MYRIPSETGVVKVIVDEGVINADSEPLLVYDNTGLQKKVAPEK
jgi:ATP-dependent Clp protease ATP-binding subunit ClpX